MDSYELFDAWSGLKFYEFQPESMRNSIAKSFSDLYSETHEVDKRISRVG